jgi:hypothetical protein
VVLVWIVIDLPQCYTICGARRGRRAAWRRARAMQGPYEYHLIKYLVISYTGVHLIRPLSPQAGEGFPNPMSCRS